VNNGRAKKDHSDAILYSAKIRADLERLVTLRTSLVTNGSLWVIRPKGVRSLKVTSWSRAGPQGS
jgi:hypothetical protein